MSTRFALPPQTDIMLRLSFSSDGLGQLYATASAATADGLTVTAHMSVPAGVTQLYSRQKDIDGWMYSTACRAADEVITRLLSQQRSIPEIDHQPPPKEIPHHVHELD